mmetsp:Transcript_47631/g.124798  ORF Transcript_47631/g.124798 Transcript_47631/m.124798 type:complete len:228 (+) Transcript_47631:219-902(+)
MLDYATWPWSMLMLSCLRACSSVDGGGGGCTTPRFIGRATLTLDLAARFPAAAPSRRILSWTSLMRRRRISSDSLSGGAARKTLYNAKLTRPNPAMIQVTTSTTNQPCQGMSSMEIVMTWPARATQSSAVRARVTNVTEHVGCQRRMSTRCIMVTAIANVTKRMGPSLGASVAEMKRDEPIPESMPTTEAFAPSPTKGTSSSLRLPSNAAKIPTRPLRMRSVATHFG